MCLDSRVGDFSIRHVPGFRYRFNVPPDQPRDPKILLHRILLLAGLVPLGLGLWGGWRYFQLKPPADADLHPVPLQNVLSITEIRNPHATNNLRALELHTADHQVIRYAEFWPSFDRVRQRDTNLTLLVNGANQVWLVKDASGQEFGRDYFRKSNLELKPIAAFAAIVYAPLGTLMILPALVLEYRLRRHGRLPLDGASVSARKFTFYAGLAVYLFLFGLVICPWLDARLPGIVVALVWVLSAAALGNLILWCFRPKRSKRSELMDITNRLPLNHPPGPGPRDTHQR